MSIVLSFDVSVRSTGWSVLEDKTLIGMGIIPTFKETPLEDVVRLLSRAAKFLCNTYKPDKIVVENSYFQHNVKVLKSLEACRTAVKLACFAETSIWPDELLTSEYRPHFDVSTKEEVFDYVKELFGLKFLEFENHNDITDSLLLGLRMFSREQGDTQTKHQEASLLGILSGNKCVDQDSNWWLVAGNDEETILTKYRNIPNFVDGPVFYDKKGSCHFTINKCRSDSLDFSLFDLSSLCFVLLDSLFSRGGVVYFKANKSIMSRVPETTLKCLNIKRLKTMYKIDKEVFMKKVVPELKKKFGLKGTKTLLSGAKIK